MLGTFDALHSLDGATPSGGGSVTLSATVGGTTPAYAWYHDSLLIPGETNATLTLSKLQTTDAGRYYLIATNTQGTVTSQTATVTVTATAVVPAVSVQPQGLSVLEGNAATFTATVTGTAPLTYQWTKNGINIPGANSNSYAIAAAQGSDAGNYLLTATNSVGTIGPWFLLALAGLTALRRRSARLD